MKQSVTLQLRVVVDGFFGCFFYSKLGLLLKERMSSQRGLILSFKSSP